MNPEPRQEILDLARRGMKIRAIARKLGYDVKTVRRALAPQKPPPSSPAPTTPSSKIAPFLPALAERAKQGLKSPRILRDLQAMGYTGSHSLVKKHLRRVRPPLPPKAPVRRFETEPGHEAQVDWSVYRVPIAGATTLVHAFAMVLAWSRARFVMFCRDEKLSTLLHAHVEAFEYFRGLCETLVYDNMTTVTLGRLSGQPVWNEAFLDFSRYYAYRPKVCRPRHPQRKGRVERIFHYLETDFLAGRSFASWDDLHAQTRAWLDQVANARLHGTTRETPAARLERERPVLIALPPRPYATERRETRRVDRDGAVQVLGSFFPAPGLPIGSEAIVAISAQRVAIRAADGRVVAGDPLPERPTRILPTADPTSGRAVLSRSERESRFRAYFPEAEAFLEGLVRRHKTLVHVHLSALERLRGIYGERAVREAVLLAQAARNYNARAVERILEHTHPDVVPDPPAFGPFVPPHVLGGLEDVDAGSPADYPFDSVDPSEGGAA